MDRRTVIALATCLPLASSTPTLACSAALRNPGMSGRQINQVRKIFQSWWERDAEAFREFFKVQLIADGSRMESGIAAELMELNPVPQKTYEIFDRYFTDEQKTKKLPLIIGTDAGIIVVCSEDGRSRNPIRPDCSGMPQLHMFLVKMSGLNPRSIVHLTTEDTVEIEKFDISTFASE